MSFGYVIIWDGVKVFFGVVDGYDVGFVVFFCGLLLLLLDELMVVIEYLFVCEEFCWLGVG